MSRIYVNVGKADGFFAGNLIDTINKNSRGHRVDVGRIDLLPSYSLFDVRKGDAAVVVQALKGADFMGKRLHCEVADAEKDYARVSARRKREAASSSGNYEKYYKKGVSKKGDKRKK
jgi:ATP-dependent RNA helicase DeaD